MPMKVVSISLKMQYMENRKNGVVFSSAVSQRMILQFSGPQIIRENRKEDYE